MYVNTKTKFNKITIEEMGWENSCILYYNKYSMEEYI